MHPPPIVVCNKCKDFVTNICLQMNVVLVRILHLHTYTTIFTAQTENLDKESAGPIVQTLLLMMWTRPGIPSLSHYTERH